MPIRWKNTEVHPVTDSPVIKFLCRYPVLFLLPMLGLAGYAAYWWRWLTELENGTRKSLYVGPLRILYELAGKPGVSGVYLLLSCCFGYLFWYYAIRPPRR
ncbi:hypothetical protein [Hymenobacter weizhouensis]|uniref:hypothetical protein n=1 Tax=Hymenobacter sp. YIM 151500-1 TaxID=2987689 RepID=UPI002227B294|nr:hypothetical protein [Hymenobacter sp. YIM 151500-1]UYZ62556.1 hypothetical protein OIS53_16340 [Hymenobacter sp. YIM 151500-1]